MKLSLLITTLFAALLSAGAAVAAETAPVPQPTAPQQSQRKGPDYSALLAEMDASGSAVQQEAGVIVSRADFECEGRKVEAISFIPFAEAAGPGLLLIPGHATTARDWVGNGLAFAAAGYNCLAITQPGYGNTEGPADFVGPWTLAVLTAGWDRLKAMDAVDPERLGIVGYSRGALAAALLAEQLADCRAAVLGAGIYDFQSAYDSAAPLIRQNMETETGLTAEAIAQRSPLQRLDGLQGSLLILHGDADANAPVEQAYLLRDKLTELGKDFEIQIFTGAEHSIGLKNFRDYSLEFLGRKLAVSPWGGAVLHPPSSSRRDAIYGVR